MTPFWRGFGAFPDAFGRLSEHPCSQDDPFLAGFSVKYTGIRAPFWGHPGAQASYTGLSLVYGAVQPVEPCIRAGPRIRGLGLLWRPVYGAGPAVEPCIRGSGPGPA